MAYPVLTGAVLVEANGAALNNAGQAEGTRADNAIVVKQIRVGRLHYPYVSGQAWRRWWREVLYEDFNWEPSPVTVIKQPQQAYTAGDPIRYKEDDLFGYMVARKRRQAAGTFRRVAPLKNSLLISVLPNVIERDFAHFTRFRRLTPGTPSNPDPLLYEAEHYTTYLQGVFTVSLSDVGRFEVGEMYDLSEDILKEHQGVLERDENDERVYRLPKPKRIERVQQVARALAKLRGGARLARNLSDVSPIVVLVGFVDGGNAPFQQLFKPDENNERVLLNLERLGSVLTDYEDRLLKPDDESKALFFGYRPTVLANEEKVLKAFREQEPFKDCIEVPRSGTPQQALERAAELVERVFEGYVP